MVEWDINWLVFSNIFFNHRNGRTIPPHGLHGLQGWQLYTAGHCDNASDNASCEESGEDGTVQLLSESWRKLGKSCH